MSVVSCTAGFLDGASNAEQGFGAWRVIQQHTSRPDHIAIAMEDWTRLLRRSPDPDGPDARIFWECRVLTTADMPAGVCAVGTINGASDSEFIASAVEAGHDFADRITG